MPEQPPDRSADAVVRAITRGEVDTYADLRAHALVESPWAFTNAPSEDRTPDQVRASLDPAINAIIGVFVLHAKSGAVPQASPPRLAAITGVVRSTKSKSAHLAMLWGVYTHPDFRGRGLGRLAVEGAIEAARAWDGVGGVCLSVSARTEPAIALYRSLGFREWGREPDATRIGGESADEVYMRLTL